MRLKQTSFLFILFFLSYACSSKRQLQNSKSELSESIRETQYYKVFIEATKHSFYPGNERSAIALYSSCVEEFPERAAPYYQLSSIYLRKQDIKNAQKYAFKATQRDTMNLWYKVHLANIYQYAGNLDSAILLYEDLVRLKPDDDMKYNLAMIYSEKGYNSEALTLLDSMESINQESLEIMLMKHNVYHNMKAYDDAVLWLENMNTLFPDDINNKGMLAEYLAEIGRNDYSKKVYNDILATDSLNGLVLLSFADSYLKDNQVDSAFIYYKKALCKSSLKAKEKVGVIANFVASPEFIKANSDLVMDLLYCLPLSERGFSYYALLADIHVTLEDYESAKTSLDSSLVYEKNNYVLWEQALLINNSLELQDEIIRISSECLAYFPEKFNLYLIRGFAYRNLDSIDMGIADMDTLLTKDLEDGMKIQAYVLLGELYREKGVHPNSDNYFEMALAVDKNNLMVRNNYAYYLSVRSENLDLAEELSSYTVIIEPNNATYLDTYGWILFKMGKYNKAKDYIESAIRNGAYNNPEVLEHYGYIMEKIGKCKDAIEAYENAFSLDSTQVNLIDKIIQQKRNCQE